MWYFIIYNCSSNCANFVIYEGLKVYWDLYLIGTKCFDWDWLAMLRCKGLMWYLSQLEFIFFILDFYGKSTKRSAIIRNNRNYLLKTIQSNEELISSLLSLNCITKEQSHFILRQRSKRNKNAELLKIVRSFDETKFKKFVKCLRQTNQTEVARVVESGGGSL